MTGIFLASPNFSLQRGPDSGPFAGDVLQEWIGGYVVRCGDYRRFYDVAYAQQLQHDEALVGFAFRSSEYFPLVYPPFYYLLVSPLSRLPFPVAALLWAGLMVVAYTAAWRLFERCCASVGCVKLAKQDGNHAIHVTASADTPFAAQWCVRARESRESNAFSASLTHPTATAWLLPLSLLFMPLIENFTTCQKGGLLLLILTATYYLLTKQRPYWAGIIFGLIAFKPQFALPIAIAMLCKRQWRFVLGGMTTGSVLVGLCLLMGLDVCRQYVDFSTHFGEYLQNSGYDLTKSHTWGGFFTLLSGDSQPTTTILTVVAGGITIGIVAWSLRGPLDMSSDRFAWQFSSLVIATVLLSPHLYTYDLTVVLLPLGLVATRSIGYQPVRAEGHSTHRLKAYAMVVFCLVGLSPKLAAMTGVQLSVPLLLAFLWANKKAADDAASGHRLEHTVDAQAGSLCYEATP